MTAQYDYVIIGAGLAGASAIEGIRELDPRGSILLLGREKAAPYNRPPLSKQLWSGKKKLEDIFVHDAAFYGANKVDLSLGVGAAALDPEKKEVRDDHGRTVRYRKLLLATGAAPRTLQIPGGDLPEIRCYRYLADYLAVRAEARENRTALVIGGGFIGSEMAAALAMNRLAVIMLFPGRYLVDRIVPQSLGEALQRSYAERGLRIAAGDRAARIERKGSGFVTHTEKGEEINSDLVIAGIGVTPDVELAQQASLKIGNGILVNELLQTSNPDIYAAGDNACFPLYGLDMQTRVEHWDNAQAQGRKAGRNMAGAGEAYDYMPYFFSDLFEFGYEAVGEVSSALETYCDWQKEYDTGVVYYLKNGVVRGVMLCNIWERLDEARALIKSKKRFDSPAALKGAIGGEELQKAAND